MNQELAESLKSKLKLGSSQYKVFDLLMERWGKSEPNHNVNMSETEIRNKFQLLKKDSSGNHNLLKSRSCEKCIETGNRGKPLGLEFWYFGNDKWLDNIPQSGSEAEKGCVGQKLLD